MHLGFWCDLGELLSVPLKAEGFCADLSQGGVRERRRGGEGCVCRVGVLTGARNGPR